MCYYTKGSYTWTELYFDMPVYLRNYHYNKLVEALNKESAAVEKAKSGGSTEASGPIPQSVLDAIARADQRGPNDGTT